MITRQELYFCFIVLVGIFVFDIFSTHNAIEEIQKGRIEVRDSVLTIQKDSALARAIQSQKKADSLQQIIDRKDANYKKVQKKIEDEKKNVLVLGADSTLSVFERSTAH